MRLAKRQTEYTGAFFPDTLYVRVNAVVYATCKLTFDADVRSWTLAFCRTAVVGRGTARNVFIVSSINRRRLGPTVLPPCRTEVGRCAVKHLNVYTMTATATFVDEKSKTKLT